VSVFLGTPLALEDGNVALSNDDDITDSNGLVIWIVNTTEIWNDCHC